MKKFSSIISAFLLMVSSFGANAGSCWDAKPDLNDCKVRAEQGFVRAQYSLGWMYALGRGVLRDYVMAYMFCSIAVKNGGEESKG